MATQSRNVDPIVIPSKTEWLDGCVKRSENNIKDIIGISMERHICLMCSFHIIV